jgi:hypothetical protein
LAPREFGAPIEATGAVLGDAVGLAAGVLPCVVAVPIEGAVTRPCRDRYQRQDEDHSNAA